MPGWVGGMTNTCISIKMIGCCNYNAYSGSVKLVLEKEECYISFVLGREAENNILPAKTEHFER